MYQWRVLGGRNCHFDMLVLHFSNGKHDPYMLNITNVAKEIKFNTSMHVGWSNTIRLCWNETSALPVLKISFFFFFSTLIWNAHNDHLSPIQSPSSLLAVPLCSPYSLKVTKAELGKHLQGRKPSKVNHNHYQNYQPLIIISLG